MVRITDIAENLDTYLAMDLFTEDTKERVKDADVILLPDIGKIEGIAKAFRPDTKIFYRYVTKHPTDKKFEILENEGELNVLNFHSHEVWLPVMYIGHKDLLSTVMNVVNDYVQEKQARKSDELVVNFALQVENKAAGACKSLSFKGSLKELNEAMAKVDRDAL